MINELPSVFVKFHSFGDVIVKATNQRKQVEEPLYRKLYGLFFASPQLETLLIPSATQAMNLCLKPPTSQHVQLLAGINCTAGYLGQILEMCLHIFSFGLLRICLLLFCQ